ncbi:LysM peptidoglycan-binding domain-containing protein [Belliella sp. DSM 111904]|uniref:LysM peptidoglycan-binding domain-containing protein n=1 Tax=Belliella filtrata TaxID=2923435 RepID=A0ABS9V5H7_9BACT|nr:LysM peptidoglycan-binding domain-containing protein [Belliella filtrata]MCH7411680.1 LysM peptidoglycan-binding domain-containing protein [Belliella filtrata]
MKRITFITLLFIYSMSIHAMEAALLDSVGVERVGGKTFIIHQVEQQETLFGISRRYAASVNDIVQANEELKAGLKMGQRIRIPYVEPEALPQGSILHNVAQGETLFAISKKYNVAVGDIMAWNNLKGNDLSLGQSLVIKGVEKPVAEVKQVAEATPATMSKAEERKVQAVTKAEEKKVDAKAKVEEAKQKENAAKEAALKQSESASSTGDMNFPGEWISHTVAQGETLFAVAKMYDSKVEDLINWNGLTSNNLSVGQKLKVGRGASGPSKVPVVSSTVPVIVNNEKSEATLTTAKTEDTSYKNIKETGLAEVIDGTGNHKKYLVLHRDAPVGTIMRVRNEENDITIFARVVGKLPSTGDNSRLVVKVSKAAFDQLRAVNSRFPVEVSY